jgi:RNA polymerase sigma-70 factor (ECF subfamily)
MDESELAEEELVRRIREGDESALPALFDRHLETLTRYARAWLPAKLNRKVSVADVLQEARIAALKRRLDFEHRGPGSARNWLLRIVELKVKEAVRAHAGTGRRAVDREISRGGRPDTGQLEAKGPSPSEVVAGAEAKDLADRALAELPEHYREVLQLARVERLSLREVAERTDRSREAVKKIYARALAQFTREFKRIAGDSHG